MILDIKADNLYLSYPFKTYLSRRIHNAFERTRDNISRVTVTLSDINGPRGGDDKQCKLKLSLAGLPAIMVIEKQDNLNKAFAKALATADHTLKRKLNKQHNHREPMLLAG